MPDFAELAGNDLGSPWLRPAEGKPTWTIKEAVELLTVPGEDQLNVYNQLKGWTATGLLHPVRKEPIKRTSPALYDAVDIGAGGVFRELRALGVSLERGTGAQASLACYSFNRSLNPPPPYLRDDGDMPPIVAAMMAALRDRASAGWVFEMISYVHDQTRARETIAVVYDMDYSPRPQIRDFLDPALLPRGTVSLLLAPILKPLASKLFTERAKGMN